MVGTKFFINLLIACSVAMTVLGLLCFSIRFTRRGKAFTNRFDNRNKVHPGEGSDIGNGIPKPPQLPPNDLYGVNKKPLESRKIWKYPDYNPDIPEPPNYPAPQAPNTRAKPPIAVKPSLNLRVNKKPPIAPKPNRNINNPAKIGHNRINSDSSSQNSGKSANIKPNFNPNF